MNVRRRRVLAACLAMGIGSSGCLETVSTPPQTDWPDDRSSLGWAAASGRHYDIGQDHGPDTTPEGRPLYRTIRSPAGGQTSGLSRDLTGVPSEQWPDDATEVTGPFTGGTRYYDFGSLDREESMAAEVARNTRGDRDGIMLIDTNVEEELRENVTAFKDAVYAAARFFATGSFAGRPLRYWQVGNEVNNIEYFNPRGIELEDDENHWDYFNDAEQARLYVDLMLAPAIEALREAGEDVFGDPEWFTVLAGSVAEINHQYSQSWLDLVLESEPSAETAPSIAGSPVVEHVDVVTVHYAFNPHFDEHAYDFWWDETLSRLHERWIEPGAVRGLWHTEEGGSGRWGASHFVFAMPRFLRWWSNEDMTEDRARLVWWPKPGGTDNYAAEDLQALLVDLWNGSDRLVDVSDGLVTDESASLEGFAFVADEARPRIGAFVSGRRPPGGTLEEPTGEFTGFRLERVPGSVDPASYSIDARVVEPDRLRPIAVEMDRVGTSEPGGVRFEHRPTTLEPVESLVVMVEPTQE